MRRLVALVLLVAACSEKKGEPAAPPSPLLDPSHPESNQTAPAEFKVRFETSKGTFVVHVFRDWSPRGADRFYSLVKIGYYDGCRFFRVVPGFVVQWGIHGDPKVNARWREANIPDDPPRASNVRSTICFATSGPNSRTTQLFVNLNDNKSLDSQGFSPFGKVIEGMDVVDALYSGYGEGAPRGRGPDQEKIQRRGNDYLQREFEKLDFIRTARLID